MTLSDRDGYFRSVFEKAGVCLAVIEMPSGIVQEANSEFCELFGYAKTGICGQEISVLLSSDDAIKFDLAIQKTAHSKCKKCLPDLQLNMKNGDTIWCRITISFLSQEAGDRSSFIVSIEDISGHKKHEAALIESRQFYKKISDSARDFMFTKDAGRRYTFVNSAMEELFGISSGELIGKTPEELFDEETAAMIEAVDLPALSGQDISEVREMIIQNRKYTFHTIQVPLYDQNGIIVGLSGIVRDITKEKEFEKQLMNMIAEKDILLKEIHHRVKNNLQILSSLLSLQERSIGADNIRQLFSDSRQRIRSMALVHEKLYQSGDFSHIDFPDFIRSLTDEMYTYSHLETKKIVVHCTLETVRVPIDKAVPLALIANELITNSYCHAFTDCDGGDIFIQFGFQPESGCYLLEVSDNGVGFSDGFDPRNTKSLGYRLICALTDQIDGAMQLSSNSGARISIQLPYRAHA